MQYRLYADDLKIFCHASSPEDRAQLQETIDSVLEWSNTNGMKLSIPKCAVLKTVPDDTVYYLDGHPLPLVPSIRDLGVIFDSDLKFRSHIVHVAKTAGRVSNLIMRTFILTDPALYITLYRTLVIPRFLYCSTVWYPTYDKDWHLLQRVQNMFTRRLAHRCHIPASEIELAPLSQLLGQADRSFALQLTSQKRLHNILSINSSHLRRGISVRPPEIPRTFVVNNSYAWRLCTIVNEDATFRKVLITLLNKGD